MLKALNFCVKRSLFLNNTAFLQRIAPVTTEIKTPDVEPAKTKSSQKTTTIYKPIYHFPPIKLISVVGRVKMLHLGLTVLGIPLAATLSTMEYLPPNTEYAVAFVGLSIFNTFCVFSFFFRNTIGMIYITENEQTLKIVSCNFKGNRVDTIINATDWMLFSELPQVKICSLFFHTTRTYDNKHWWKMFHSNGKILDEKLFNKVLGDPTIAY